MSTLKTTYIKNPDNTGTSNVELEQSGTITVTGGVNASGIITASSFSGDGSALTGIGIGTDGSVNTSGIITASSFSGDITGTASNASNASGATGDFSIADKIVHTGDTNTTIRFPTDDTVTVETAGSEALRVDSSGRLMLGVTSGTGKFIVQDSSLPKIQSNFGGTKHLEMGVGGSGGGFSMTTGHFLTVTHQPYADRGTDNNLTERFRIGPSGQIGLSGANYGDSGQVLTSNGSGSAPTWQDVGGAWNLVATVNASNASTATFQGNLDSTYKQYVAVLSEITSSGAQNSELRMTFMVGATDLTGSLYDTTASRTTVNSSTAFTINQNDAAFGRLSNAGMDTDNAGHFVSAVVWLSGGRSSTQHAARFESINPVQATNGTQLSGMVKYTDTTTRAVDGIKFFPSNDTFSGTFKLYGLS